ncbi:MAG: 2,3-bisphosphoglycerate-independent phosphoglycerate mutase [Gammaproteobacteria bacterium]|nr:MAG: 2,3-bisphosphoglycerate-independent phosphoglycerate mutase [Gammaproteobacteria bacterium]
MADPSPRSTTMLLVLDGFGHAETTEGNAIAAAEAPVWSDMWQRRPHRLIATSGHEVGLPSGQMGNSEVGHMNLGAGRVVYQELTRINKDVSEGRFAENPVLHEAMDVAIAKDRPLHILGLLSPGGVHSHEDHIAAMVEAAHARGVSRIYVHAFLDGRDTPPRSALASLEAMEQLLTRLDCGQIASLVGRYYAMDRDQRWDRLERAYNLLTRGEAPFHAPSASSGLKAAYGREENDEFVEPTSIHSEDSLPIRIEDDDVVVFMNFRADRARQLSHAFVDEDFEHFRRRTRPDLGRFVMLTRYADDLDAPCAYPPTPLDNTLGEYLAGLGRTQLRIAETEKYAHVTFFFNGGREEPFTGEDRALIPSPKVATYDLQPEMSAPEVTERLVEAIRAGRYDFIVCNYANGDMVGHTGVFDAAVKAVEVLDECLGQITAALEETGGQCLLTADHGNVEKMRDPDTGQAHTAHTTEPVPLVYIGPKPVRFDAEPGCLADIAPTLLELMEIERPAEMTGRSLLERRS